MWCKVLLIAAAVLVCSQALPGQRDATNKKADIEYAEIDGITYLIDTLTGFSHDEAKSMCASIGMTLLTFEGGQQKWDSINNYLSTHGYDYWIFWTGGLKAAGSSDWYWESSGQAIADNEFFWATGEPSLQGAGIRTCMLFNYIPGGYDDIDCLEYYYDAICQGS